MRDASSAVICTCSMKRSTSTGNPAATQSDRYPTTVASCASQDIACQTVCQSNTNPLLTGGPDPQADQLPHSPTGIPTTVASQHHLSDTGIYILTTAVKYSQHFLSACRREQAKYWLIEVVCLTKMLHGLLKMTLPEAC